MKFLDTLRTRRSRIKSNPSVSDIDGRVLDDSCYFATSFPPNPTRQLPPDLLVELLSYVCPHAQDGSYVCCEDSMMDGGCMLCDMRDLASCARVDRQWSVAVTHLL